MILLVEDNPDEEKLALRALRQGGYADAVHVVRDGHEAIEFIERFENGVADPPPRPSLVLLDLKLPKVGGLDVLRRLRSVEALAMVPVVVCSSSDEDSDLRQSYTLGANSYIRKPVDFDEFSETIRQIGQYWLTRNQVPSR